MHFHSYSGLGDWVEIIVYLLVTLTLGLYFTRRASKDIQSFFVSNRSIPWFLSGISMIATSFASDTPLWITSVKGGRSCRDRHFQPNAESLKMPSKPVRPARNQVLGPA